MRIIILLLLSILIFLSGCTQQTGTGEKLTQSAPSVQPEVEERVETTVTQGLTPSSPKTYNVNVAQGIGVKERA